MLYIYSNAIEKLNARNLIHNMSKKFFPRYWKCCNISYIQYICLLSKLKIKFRQHCITGTPNINLNIITRRVLHKIKFKVITESIKHGGAKPQDVAVPTVSRRR